LQGKLFTEELLDKSGVNWTSVRPVYIYGAARRGAASKRLLAYLPACLPCLPACLPQKNTRIDSAGSLSLHPARF
jgi:uncharacterized protein YbjT (DUF2867 family)